MNQEEILKNAYLARGAIDIFRIMQEDIFNEITIALPPMSFPVEALYHGLIDIKEKIIHLKEMVASNVPEVEMLQTTIKDINPIIRCLSGEDDEGDFVTICLPAHFIEHYLLAKRFTHAHQLHHGNLVQAFFPQWLFARIGHTVRVLMR